MGKYSDTDITKLQNNLLLIRNAGGWTAEVFGDMIGVTKQTISNLENKKTEMTKTQYIAIRAVLVVSEEDQKKIQAFVSGAQKTGLDSAAVIAGIEAIIGVVASEAIASPALIAASGAWLAKLLKSKRD